MRYNLLTAIQALIPLFTVLFSENQLIAKHLALPTYTVLDGPAAETKTSPERQPHTESYGILAVLVISATAVLGVYAVPTTVALGLSSAIFAATGLVLFESTIKVAIEDGEGGKRGLGSTNGSGLRRASLSGASRPQRLAALRDVAVAITVVCGIASILTESSLTASTISWEPVYKEYDREWRDVHNLRILQRFLWMLPVHSTVNVLIFVLVRTRFQSTFGLPKSHILLPNTGLAYYVCRTHHYPAFAFRFQNCVAFILNALSQHRTDQLVDLSIRRCTYLSVGYIFTSRCETTLCTNHFHHFVYPHLRRGGTSILFGVIQISNGDGGAPLHATASLCLHRCGSYSGVSTYGTFQ
jgi:hypothetical protein